MIVSIHIPKTAGTSFNLSLGERFGQALRGDYMDRLYTTETPQERRTRTMKQALEMTPSDFEGIECVHGHFFAFKYRFLAERMHCSFITWLRHPIDRLLSHYSYWLESYDPSTVVGLHRQCIEENWSLERFCLGPEVRNIQSQFLWGTPLSSLEFVGLTEYYDQDFARFAAEYLGLELEPIRVNATKTRRRVDSLDGGLRREIEEYHAKDMALYEAALTRRAREMDGALTRAS